MSKNSFVRRVLARILPLLLIASLPVSCKSERVDALDSYRANMSRFFDNIAAYHHSINALSSREDLSVLNASDELLRYLDGLNQEFAALKTYPIPEEFTSIGDLTVDAADSMEQAVALYHEAFADGYDAKKADAARVLYNRANRCVQVIRQVLNGEEPTGDDVLVN